MSVCFKSDDDTVNDDTILAQSGPIFIEAGRKIGKSFTIIDDMKGYLEACGFVDITEVKFQWPVGPWSTDRNLKNIGMWNRLHLLESLEGFVMALLTRVLGVSEALLYIRKKTGADVQPLSTSGNTSLVGPDEVCTSGQKISRIPRDVRLVYFVMPTTDRSLTKFLL